MVEIALCFTFYLLETCLIASIYIRKRRGLECFTCVYQLDMHLAISMVDWYVYLLIAIRLGSMLSRLIS